MQGQEGEGTFQAVAGQPHRFGEVAIAFTVHDVAQQGSSNFGVGFGGESVAFRCEFGFQFSEVFDNAVVNNGEFSAVNHVRVSVGVGGCAVGCPAGVPDTYHRIGEGIARDFLVQTSYFACFLAEVNLSAFQHGYARRVVTAVFQTAKSLKYNV